MAGSGGDDPVNTEAFDAPEFQEPARLPAAIETFAYPILVPLVPGTPGLDTIICVELYAYQLP